MLALAASIRSPSRLHMHRACIVLPQALPPRCLLIEVGFVPAQNNAAFAGHSLRHRYRDSNPGFRTENPLSAMSACGGRYEIRC